MEIFGL